jgi:hypothetical protein
VLLLLPATALGSAKWFCWPACRFVPLSEGCGGLLVNLFACGFVPLSEGCGGLLVNLLLHVHCHVCIRGCVNVCRCYGVHTRGWAAGTLSRWSRRSTSRSTASRGPTLATPPCGPFLRPTFRGRPHCKPQLCVGRVAAPAILGGFRIVWPRGGC